MTEGARQSGWYPDFDAPLEIMWEGKFVRALRRGNSRRVAFGF